MNPTVISLVNNKGGVAKTTTTQNFAAALVKEGKKVLIIDGDSQGNLTIGCGLQSFDYQLADALKGEIKHLPIYPLSKNLDICPSNYKLKQAEDQLLSEVGGFGVLTDLIDENELNYDFILVDCPPRLEIMTQNALAASNHVVVCMFPDLYSAVGLSKILEAIKISNKKLGANIQSGKVLLTKIDGRTRIHKEIAKEIAETDGVVMYKTYISHDTAIQYAMRAMIDIFAYDSKTQAATDYMNFTKEFLDAK